jgi:hypothetical protein
MNSMDDKASQPASQPAKQQTFDEINLMNATHKQAVNQ